MSEKRGPTVTLPYIEGSSEQLCRAFNTAGVTAAFKPYRTLRQNLVSPKDKPDKLKYEQSMNSLVYTVTLFCIGEPDRKLKTNDYLSINLGRLIPIVQLMNISQGVTTLTTYCVSQKEVIKILTPCCSKSNKNLTIPVCWTKCSSLLDLCSI